MTPPIGLRTGSLHDSPQFAAPAGSYQDLRRSGDSEPAAISPSRAYDYAYRIVALTAGLALMTSLL